MTFETVATETPARAATSRIVIRELGSTRATVAVLKRYRQRLTGRKCRATLGGKPGWPGLECLGPCRQEMTQHAQHPEVRRYRHGGDSGGRPRRLRRQWRHGKLIEELARHSHVVDQRHGWRPEDRLAAGGHRFPCRASERDDPGRTDPERGLHHQGAGRPGLE